MALIGTLRDKMGIVLMIFIFGALAAFILGDLFTNNSVLFNQNEVGEINGHSISAKEFQGVVDERRANYILNFQREPGEREMTSIRQQAWDLLIARYAIEPEYKRVGVAVTEEEVVDMISGKNVDPTIRQAFTNPQTGEFDRNMLNLQLNELKRFEFGSPQRAQWDLFLRDLRPARERIKYENLLLKTNYVTQAEAELEYHLQTDVAEVRYVYVPYYSVGDSIEVTDAHLRAYYNENRERFKTEHTRDLKYVTFDLSPSAQDSADVKLDMETIAKEFAQTEDDSVFAISNLSGDGYFDTYNVSNVPSFISTSDLKEGSIIGPVIDGGSYKVAKVTKVFQDTVAFAQASHILIRWEDDTPAAKREAREKALGILREIRNGADFAAKAREHGTDGTAVNGGDLGWMYTGQMVKPFENAVFRATKTGLLNDLVETEFGYHIVKVDRLKDNSAYKIAIVETPITPSDNTTNEVYRRAETFAAGISSAAEFEEKARNSGFNVLEAKNITAAERRIGLLGDARQVVQWLFRDASTGEVSHVFDLQDQYVVAIMTGETEKGYRSFESIKNEIMPEVRKKVQGEAIIAKLKKANGTTLDELAQAYGADASVYSSSDLRLSSSTLPSAGFDPRAVGLAFGLADGKRSEPFAGENGVFVIETQNKTVAPEIADYTIYKTTLAQQYTQRNSFSIAEALRDHAEIEDLRYRFH